jgi:hypothetical protein
LPSKKLLREYGQTTAENFLSQAYSFGDRFIAFDVELACPAAKTGSEANLPMADAITYATARVWLCI